MRSGGCYDKWTMFDVVGRFGTEDFVVPLFQKRFYSQSGHQYEMALSWGEWKESDGDDGCAIVDDFRGPQMRFSLILVD